MADASTALPFLGGRQGYTLQGDGTYALNVKNVDGSAGGLYGSGLYAAMPAASAFTNRLYFATDIGVNGIFIYSNGTTRTAAWPQVFARNSEQLLCPADTTEDTIVTVTIPANLLGLQGRIRTTLYGTMTNNANVKTVRARFGGSAIYTGQALASNASYKMQFEMANRNSASSQLALGVSGAGAGSWGVSTAGSTTTSIDTTADRNLTLTLQKATAGDTLAIDSYLIEIMP